MLFYIWFIITKSNDLRNKESNGLGFKNEMHQKESIIRLLNSGDRRKKQPHD